MPNMFGGDQFHPAYHPDVKLKDNQVMIDNRLYTVTSRGAEWEDVNGKTGNSSYNVHPEVFDIARYLELV